MTLAERIKRNEREERMKAKNEGRREGKISERLQCVIKMMNKLKMTSQEAMNVLDIPQDEQHVINELLNEV